MKENNNSSLIFETRDSMPEIHTTAELYQMAKKDFLERCAEIEKKHGYR